VQLKTCDLPLNRTSGDIERPSAETASITVTLTVLWRFDVALTPRGSRDSGYCKSEASSSLIYVPYVRLDRFRGEAVATPHGFKTENHPCKASALYFERRDRSCWLWLVLLGDSTRGTTPSCILADKGLCSGALIPRSKRQGPLRGSLDLKVHLMISW